MVMIFELDWMWFCLMLEEVEEMDGGEEFVCSFDTRAYETNTFTSH